MIIGLSIHFKSRKELENFKEKHLKDEQFDFETIIPEPESPDDLTVAEREIYILKPSNKNGLEIKDGKDWFNWYDWHVDKWRNQVECL